MCEGGTLPPGWVWTTIGKITQPIEKVAPTQEPDAEFIYLDIASIDNSIQRITDPKRYRGADAPSRARQRVKTGDVLFSTVRTYLKNIASVPAIYDEQIASTGFSILRGIDGVLSQYLFYYCLTDDLLSALAELQRGTSYPAVRDGDVRAQRIPLPSLPEQRRIVAEIEQQFTRLDAGVAALKGVQANLKRYRASVLKAACEGRLAPQDPNDEPADRLLARILADRRAKWEAEHPGKKYVEPAAPVTDGLPALPVGWCWTRMERLIADFRSGTTAVPHDEPTDFPILRSSSVRPMTIDYSDIRYLSQEDSLSPANFLRVSDLLFTRLSGSLDYVGNCGLVDNSEAAAIQYPDRIFRAQLTEPRCAQFVEIFFSSPFARTQIKALAKSTAGHQRISMGAISEHMIPLPPLPEQHRIVAEVERRLSVVAELEATIAANLVRANRLRQAVLKRAFEGRLVVQDANDGGDREGAPLQRRTMEVAAPTRPTDHRGRGVNLRLPSWPFHNRGDREGAPLQIEIPAENQYDPDLRS